MVHEFGHGVFDVALQTTNTAMLICSMRRIHEHVGDTFAILAAGFHGEPADEQLLLDQPAGAADTVFRDFRGFVDPPPPGTNLSICAGRLHLTQVQDWNPMRCQEIHENSCVFSKIWALGREADLVAPGTYHGVPIQPVPLTEAKTLFHELVRQQLGVGTDYLGYGYAYLTASAQHMASCLSRGTCEPSLATALASPMYAVGLWSPSQALGSGIRSRVGPAVAARDGSQWIFYVDATEPGRSRVHVYEDENVLDGMPGSSRPLEDLGVPVPETASDLAAARTGDLVSLTLVSEGGEELVLAETASETDPGWRSSLVRVAVDGVAEGAGQLTVLHVRQLGLPMGPLTTLVVARVDLPNEFGSTTPRLIYFTSRDPVPKLVPDSLGHSSPALESHPDGARLWYLVGGRFAARLVSVAASGDVTWSDEESTFMVPPRGSESGATAEANGLVAAPFQGRTQLYLERLAGGVTQVTHHAQQGVATDSLYGNFWDTRAVWSSDVTRARRPAAFNGTTADGQPVQILVSVGKPGMGDPDLVILYQRRSD